MSTVDFLETEMKKLGRSTKNNTHNTRLLIKYVSHIVAGRRNLYGERVHTHTHAHTHAYIHIHTHTHTRSKSLITVSILFGEFQLQDFVIYLVQFV